MRAPSAKKLIQAFRDLDKKDANLIRAFAKAVDDPDELRNLVEKVPETEAYVRSLYSDPYGSSMWRRTLVLHAIDNLVGGHGVEVLESYDDSGAAPDYEYINMGDTYAITLIYDSNKDRLFIDTMGDIVERMENPPPLRLSRGRESVTGLYPATGGEELFYPSTDEGLRNAVSSSLNMDGDPSHFRQYQGDLRGGWKSGELVKVTAAVADPNRYEYPVRSANPSANLLDDALLATVEGHDSLTRRDFYGVWSESAYNDLKRRGLIELRGGMVVPTRAGRQRAVKLHHARESDRYDNPGCGTSKEVRKIKNRVLR